MNEPFSILVVCTGNVCRSPLAERLLRLHLDDLVAKDQRDAVTVASAGVQALAGHPMDADSAAELTRLGGSPDGFVSRQLEPAMLRETDLILTATTAHRTRILEDEPGALRRSFTLREFAALVQDVEAPDPAALVAQAARQRASAEIDEYDLDDPIGAAQDVHFAVAEAIENATWTIAMSLTEALMASARVSRG